MTSGNHRKLETSIDETALRGIIRDPEYVGLLPGKKSEFTVKKLLITW